MSEQRSDREALWIALSDLFLDTDVSLHADHIERVILAGPFDLDEVETILMDEVYPVCIGNLFEVAGEWAGFEADHLVARIRARRPGLLEPWRKRWRRRQAREMIPEWFKLRARIEGR
jgi:hypothetical protein